MVYYFVYGTKKFKNTFWGVLEQENGENVMEKVLHFLENLHNSWAR